MYQIQGIKRSAIIETSRLTLAEALDKAADLTLSGYAVTVAATVVG